MKTTLDLPEVLIHVLQEHAQQSGQDLTQAVTGLLWQGLTASPATTPSASRATIKSHPTTNLPTIVCAQPASPATEMTPGRVADILIAQEVTWQNEASR
jgi:hypothetical protein